MGRPGCRFFSQYTSSVSWSRSSNASRRSRVYCRFDSNCRRCCSDTRAPGSWTIEVCWNEQAVA